MLGINGIRFIFARIVCSIFEIFLHKIACFHCHSFLKIVYSDMKLFKKTLVCKSFLRFFCNRNHWKDPMVVPSAKVLWPSDLLLLMLLLGSSMLVP